MSDRKINPGASSGRLPLMVSVLLPVFFNNVSQNLILISIDFSPPNFHAVLCREILYHKRIT